MTILIIGDSGGKSEDLKEIYHDLTGLMLKVHDMLKAKKMEKEGLLHEENAQDG